MLPRFWRKIKYRYDIVGTVCENCGSKFYPPRNFCPICRRKGKIREQTFSSKGRILSYTVVHDAPDEYKLAKPYIVALIELDDGVVLTSQVVCDPQEVHIGMRVKKAFRKYYEDGESGIIYYGTKFVPDDGEV
ncbi:putative nucleic-acid-binding protein containing a Zn-ribbon [Archaeoglobus sulfaticallidus PM70-1]|uniref:Putative nucleic-acid-binding protein containing a Zn-ribbon n=1 Tax=Archaeoglobus sulfaticallidus PM70-1 TaxID=387631 RepID=N0BCK9_9EURY|nr:Zn-ribbon domain-containing OB-fold protein [Archaeoglobus sulfaticallidus]AGK60743.1 putative nucleic-acid-binding protein containing a Zn-ribbon [Archaeoglobus sulfaticallidus PM70-1]